MIIGAGMTGGNAAKALRAEGFDGPIHLVGDEPGVPFGRPPLSKGYLRGEESLKGWLVEPADWYEANRVGLVHETATRIDPVAHRVYLESGRSLDYSKLLLATGGRNRKLDVPGAELRGVFQLRTVADCDAIRRAAKPGARALVVGMGFIGSEVAASLRQLGVEVTAVFPGGAPLEAVLGAEVAQVVGGFHTEKGVELVPGDSVARFEGTTRLERAVTPGGRQIECDLAVVAVGIQPNVELALDAGIDCDSGILVDSQCRTSAPDVFAAGDVANVLHPLFGRVRVEHYNNAEKQGAAAATSMLRRAEFDYLYTFWSDQYEHKIEYAGHARRWDSFVVRGSLAERKFVGFYLEGGVVRAVVGLDRGGDPELEPDSEIAAGARLVAGRAAFEGQGR